MPRAFELSSLYADAPHGAPVAASLHDPDPGADAQRLAAFVGAATTAFVVPPRRDDCALRVRAFTTRRELPMSVEAALAVASRRDEEALALEVGVVRVVVRRGPDGHRVALARPVVGQIPVADRALAASALGLVEDDLHGALPVLSASCGLLSLVIPVAGPDALARAQLQPALWQRLVEKAKVFSAAVLWPVAEGDVRVRCLVPGVGDHPAAGTTCASAAAWLERVGVRSGAVRFAVDAPQGGSLSLDVTPRDAGEVEVSGRCVRAGALRFEGA